MTVLCRLYARCRVDEWGSRSSGPAGKVDALQIASNMCEISGIVVSTCVRLGKSTSSWIIVGGGDGPYVNKLASAVWVYVVGEHGCAGDVGEGRRA